MKIGLQPLIASTVGTYFQQNWSLFAPNPASANLSLFIAPSKDSSVTAIDSLEWVDITTPLLRNYQQNRFSGYERIGRVQNGALRLYLGNDPVLPLLKRACDNGDTLSCKMYDIRWKDDQKAAVEYLQRLGSSIDNQLFDPISKPYFVLGYKEVKATEWSERYLHKKQISNFHIIGIFREKTDIQKASFFAYKK